MLGPLQQSVTALAGRLPAVWRAEVVSEVMLTCYSPAALVLPSSHAPVQCATPTPVGHTHFFFAMLTASRLSTVSRVCELSSIFRYAASVSLMTLSYSFLVSVYEGCQGGVGRRRGGEPRSCVEPTNLPAILLGPSCTVEYACDTRKVAVSVVHLSMAHADNSRHRLERV